MRICTIEDVYFLKKNAGQYAHIQIDTRKLKYRGVLRHVLIYALNRLKTGGLLEISDEPFRTFSLTRKKIDFWQVKLETFRVLKDRVDILEANSTSGRILVKKKQDISCYPEGLSFGIVFGGADEELLKKAVDSILENTFPPGVPFEIIIAGPSSIDSERLLTLWHHHPNIRYLEADIEAAPRIMICRKKNLLFEACNYRIATISHTRITFSKHYAQKIYVSLLEMATPKVVLTETSEKYLDYFLINNYNDLIRTPNSHIIGLHNIDDDYLYFMRNRVPAVDGGINVFNKNIIQLPPYNNFIAWGEAEDMELSANLYQKGILIDYLPDITCYSLTNKINIRFKAIKKPLRVLYKYFWLKRK